MGLYGFKYGHYTPLWITSWNTSPTIVRNIYIYMYEYIYILVNAMDYNSLRVTHYFNGCTESFTDGRWGSWLPGFTPLTSKSPDRRWWEKWLVGNAPEQWNNRPLLIYLSFFLSFYLYISIYIYIYIYIFIYIHIYIYLHIYYIILYYIILHYIRLYYIILYYIIYRNCEFQAEVVSAQNTYMISI